MKNILHFVFKSCLGALVSMLLSVIFLILFINFFAGSLSSKKIVDVLPASVLHLKLNRPVVDRNNNYELNLWNEKNKPLALDNILEAIAFAKVDHKIKGLFIDLQEEPQIGAAAAEEIRKAIVDFKSSGKFVLAMAFNYTQLGYYIASSADSVYMHPMGMVLWKGLSAEQLYFKKFLQNTAIDLQVIRHGKYKSAVEPFLEEKMSTANREQISGFLNSTWEHLVNTIAHSRDISPRLLNEYANDLTLLRNNYAAVQHHLVDSLLYYDQFLDIMKNKLPDFDHEKNLIALTAYGNLANEKLLDNSENKIAVIFAQGEIVNEKDAKNISPAIVVKQIQEAKDDQSIKAIVLRINSPGGSSSASDLIYRELVLAQKVKPLIVSMGDVAASGGYMIAAPADKIVASENTITGSIGVFGLIPNINKMLKNFGINVETVTTHQHSDQPSVIGRAMNEEEILVGQHFVNLIYQDFIEKVSAGRKLSRVFVDSIAQGRVWTGKDALKIKLIDTIGGLETAIALAATAANINAYKLKNFPEKTSFFEGLISDFSDDAAAMVLENKWGIFSPYAQELMQLMPYKSNEALVRMPWLIKLK